ncbi:TauD/TfdA family dioxygenase [Myxococcota bacterium]|nr:TauD/TfdA family dioxygenase [Myxococcota bacterium]
MMRCTPLDAPLGARIEFGTEDPLDEEQSELLRRAFGEHGLLLLRGREISRERQIELLSKLGRIEPDTNGQPMEMEVTNQHDQSTAPEGELVFHYDYAYDPEPIPAISMYGLVVDPGSTPTLFADSHRVLSRLPQSLLNELSGREASHACFLMAPEAPSQKNREPEILIQRGERGWGPDHYWARHPMIWHNALGVDSLFACLQHTDRILGLSRSRSDEILEEIYAALYHPDHIYEHCWRPGDLLIWDNLTIQHARPEPNDVPRTLRRFHIANSDLTADYVRVGRERGYL